MRFGEGETCKGCVCGTSRNERACGRSIDVDLIAEVVEDWLDEEEGIGIERAWGRGGGKPTFRTASAIN